MKKIRLNVVLCALLVGLGVLAAGPRLAVAQDQGERAGGPVASVEEQIKTL